MADSTIHDVSDTAIWVSYYRAMETERPGALFQDPLAKKLIGDRGESIAASMPNVAKYTQFSVVVRTAVIDELIQKLVGEAVDTVLNLGAGLDTRPYRLSLPENLKWIEVDYPHMIAHKDSVLKNEKPRVQLERVSLDLANRKERLKLFARVNENSKRVLVITEGVVVYLTETQVGDLADDLHAFQNLKYWIAEYISPESYARINAASRAKLKNAPFQFQPKDWFGFFKKHRWVPMVEKYLGEEAERLRYPPPVPFPVRVLVSLFMPKSMKRKFQRMTAYVVFKRES